ncbi:MAG: death-on-curing protein [Rariglobus sp.]|nr:death-on-curing protein [Rariglobus sp.]
MSTPIAHLTVAATEAIHAAALRAHGGGAGLRDRGMLESAIAAPQATAFGEPVMTDLVEIAAAYLFYLCRNHAFVDGNKRVALGACLVFLRCNNVIDRPPRNEAEIAAWEALVLDVAASRLDREHTTARLRALLSG